MPQERYDAPALLSLVPGLGQIAKGDFWKGIGLMAGTLISLVLMLTLSIVSAIGILIYPIILFYAVHDAYNTPIEGTKGDDSSEEDSSNGGSDKESDDSGDTDD